MALLVTEAVKERKLLILYGSQTGTAQEVAERIWRESKWLHFQGPIMPMDEYPIQQLINEPLVLFVCSTTGQGEEPDNMKHFWKFLLKKNLPSNSLERMKFGVLGLGDSSYDRFNFTAKKLNARLLQLGATLLLAMGLADDQHDMGASAAIDPWLVNTWHRLAAIYPLPRDLERGDPSALPTPKWLVTAMQTPSENMEENRPTLETTSILKDRRKSDLPDEVPTSARSQLSERPARSVIFAPKPNELKLMRNKRTTTKAHFQDVRLLEFMAIGVKYKPGDILSVKPHNSPENIARFFKIFAGSKVCKLTPETVLLVTETNPEMPVPEHLSKPVTVLECAEKYWDLNAVPRRYFFELMAHFTSSELERDKMRDFMSPLHQEELYNYANRPRRTVVEVLEDFWNAAKNIPLEFLFEVFQPIRTRSFSIASSPHAHMSEVHLLVAKVTYSSSLVTPRLGLCSNWLVSMEEGTSFPATVHPGSFTFPLDKSTPVVMIGPGTGLAPFRSYIHERHVLGTASSKRLVLFFGCRYEATDFHCKDELQRLVAQDKLTLFCAFSRDTERKIYVQHLITEQSALLWDLIWNKGGHIYVAGSAKNMPSAVREAFVYDVLVKNGMQLNAAMTVIKRFEHTGRYQSDTWS